MRFVPIAPLNARKMPTITTTIKYDKKMDMKHLRGIIAHKS